jgi:hypothetical protein
MSHLRHLSVDIGPRGSTTPEERLAASFARRHFEASVFLEMYFQPNPLRAVVFKGRSQNVWARIPASKTPARRVLLVAHLDSHRTPWAFTSPRKLLFLRVMTTVGVGSFVLATLLYFLVLLTEAALLRWLPTALVPVFMTLLGLTLEPDATPFTHGANDNASGVSIVLSLASRLSRSPLPRTGVWALCSGCEEVGSYGVQAFVNRHRSELRGVFAIGLDNVGGKGVGACLHER